MTLFLILIAWTAVGIFGLWKILGMEKNEFTVSDIFTIVGGGMSIGPIVLFGWMWVKFFNMDFWNKVIYRK